MKKLIMPLIILIIMSFSFSFTGDFSYVGVDRCGMCHKGSKKGEVYEKWKAGPHANAFENLKATNDENNPECLVCHVTGFDKSGYKIGDPDASKFEGVQCESCHGPGSDYRKISIMKDKDKALQNGLIVPDEALCIKCHNENSPDFKGFDYKVYLNKIDHNYR